MKKIRTDLKLKCSCGAESSVFRKGDRWYSHCINCGRMSFWSNDMLSERLKYGAKLCTHHPVEVECKGGKTSFCPLCRIRVFIPAKA